MIICQNCKAKNPDKAEKCFNCGISLTQQDQSLDVHALKIGDLLHDGRYSIGRILGQGGFGITYLCGDLIENKTVAIKELFVDGCARKGSTVKTTSRINPHDFENIKDKFISEGQQVQKFNHPGIVKVFSTFKDNNTAYIVMEYLEGQNLHDRVNKNGVLEEHAAVNYIVQVAEALEHIHKKNYLHRDVKPSNIILTKANRVVLIDFGSARQFAAETKRMTVMLSRGYAPPEQYASKVRPSSSMDIYGLGATLYFLLTGKTPEEALNRERGFDIKPPRNLNAGISQEMNDIILWTLHLKASERPQSIPQLIDALKPKPKERESHPNADEPSDITQPGVFWQKAKVVFPYLLVIVAVLLILYAGLNQTGQSPEQDPEPEPKPPVQADPEESKPVSQSECMIRIVNVSTPTSIRTENSNTAKLSVVVEIEGKGNYQYQWTCEPGELVNFTDPNGSFELSHHVKTEKQLYTDLQLSSKAKNNDILTIDFKVSSTENESCSDFLLEKDKPKIKVVMSGQQDLSKTIINPKDGTKLIFIPAGEFICGDNKKEDFEGGQGRFKVNLPAYYIGETEVTNAQYKKFVDETGHPRPANTKSPLNDIWVGNDYPAGKADHPVVNIKWEDAKAYCDWAGLRLPTELEWEKAARGTDGRDFPWGNKRDDNKFRCWYNRKSETTCKVRDYPSGRSPYGLYNMSGNAWEWCAEFYDKNIYSQYKNGDITPPTNGNLHILRGGSWRQGTDFWFRCACRYSERSNYADSQLGFRCAKDF